MPNQNAPPKVAAPQSEAASLERELADDLGDKLSTGWLKYTELFGEPPHGTTKQMAALVDLSCVDALLSAERQRRELRESLSKVIRLERLMSGDSERDEECYKALLDAEAEAEALLEGGK